MGVLSLNARNIQKLKNIDFKREIRILITVEESNKSKEFNFLGPLWNIFIFPHSPIIRIRVHVVG